eukprot:818082-Rhodomonas_salina.1
MCQLRPTAREPSRLPQFSFWGFRIIESRLKPVVFAKRNGAMIRMKHDGSGTVTGSPGVSRRSQGSSSHGPGEPQRRGKTNSPQSGAGDGDGSLTGPSTSSTPGHVGIPGHGCEIVPASTGTRNSENR